MINRIRTRLKYRREDLEHYKAAGDWGKCLRLEGQIAELEVMLSDLTAQKEAPEWMAKM